MTKKKLTPKEIKGLNEKLDRMYAAFGMTLGEKKVTELMKKSKQVLFKDGIKFNKESITAFDSGFSLAETAYQGEDLHSILTAKFILYSFKKEFGVQNILK